jgi:hypothetical protein
MKKKKKSYTCNTEGQGIVVRVFGGDKTLLRVNSSTLRFELGATETREGNNN